MIYVQLIIVKAMLKYNNLVKMSRIIIKNVPKVFSEKEIVAHFSKVDQITDCKVMKNEKGESRKFAFVGFKGRDTAGEVIRKYDNTYLGISKVKIEVAWLKGEHEQQQEQERDRSRDKPVEANSKPKSKGEQSGKTFQSYKKVIQQQVKKSWDDLLVPSQQIQQQLQQEEHKQKNSKNNKQTPIQQAPIVHYTPSRKAQVEVKPIKAPQISEKNKQFVTKPLQIDSNRLYITNIPYILEQTDIRSAFSRFGNITKIKLPKQYDNKTKGYFFLTYQKPEQALRAFSQLDNKVVFGRIIHIKPSLQDIGAIIKTGKETIFQAKIKQQYGNAVEEKSSFKKARKRQMRLKLNDTTNWNSLFLNPNTILERMARKLHITKSEILLSDNLAPKIALAEAEVIEETKQWMAENAINLQFMEGDRLLCERSKKTLLVKNLNYRTQESELRELFGFYGIVEKLMVAPNRAIAIVELQNAEFAQNVMRNLQNQKFKNAFLYLQYAPVGMINEQRIEEKIETLKKQAEEAEELSKVVYIKNLNFQTEEQALYELFEKVGPIKYAKIVRSKEGRSMGFGFVEYESTAKAHEAIKKFNQHLLDGHKLLLSLSRRKVQNVEEIKALREKIQKEETGNNKLLVKNLAFQATKNEITDLFKEFGSLKKVRLPKKMDGQHRGFAFIEYESVQQAALAKQALSSAHLYGRKLVIEYEKGSQN